MAARGLWEGVDRLLERLEPDFACRHGLGPLAARRLRLRGEPVPEQLLREERAARGAALIAPALLERVREAYDGPLLLLKGPELTRVYPGGARRLADLDLVAGDAERAQEALLTAGFRERPYTLHPDYDLHHHLHPLVWPGIPMPVEIHRRVPWPRGLAGPRSEELFEAAVPSSVEAQGILTLSPPQHAVVLAAHAWREVAPLQKLRALVDVLAFTDDDDRQELGAIARRWDFERGWYTTLAAADWLLRDAEEPVFVRYWARYIRQLREPTVLELHLQAWLSPFSLTQPRIAARLSAAAVLRDLRPQTPQEGWAAKGRRVARGLLHPLSRPPERVRRSIDDR